jgi:hypothetical protein
LENARQAAQLGLSQSAEQRAGQQYGLQSAESQQAMAIKRAAESREAAKFLSENLGMTPAQLQNIYQTSGEITASWLEHRCRHNRDRRLRTITTVPLTARRNPLPILMLSNSNTCLPVIHNRSTSRRKAAKFTTSMASMWVLGNP